MTCDCRGCCVYPHGRMSIYAMIFSIIGAIFGSNTLWLCDYVRSSDGYKMGLMSREKKFDSSSDLECEVWEEVYRDQFDATWKAARALGILAQILGVIAMIFLICSSCMSFDMWVFKYLTITTALSGLFVILTLIALSSDFCSTFSLVSPGNCEFSVAAGLAIGASLSWWITALLISRIGEPYEPQATATPLPAAASAPPGTVTVTEQVFPDGTKKIIKTTVNADGSKTVVETVMPPGSQP